MKSVFEKDGFADLTARVSQLHAASQPLWGEMSVTEMLHHCNLTTHAILEGKASPKTSTLKQKALKFLFLNVIRKLPKNATAPKKFNVKLNQIIPGEFDKELNEYLDLLKKINRHEEEITLSHPRFGSLNTGEWGKFVWLHLDHHLKQFGV